MFDTTLLKQTDIQLKFWRIFDICLLSLKVSGLTR